MGFTVMLDASFRRVHDIFTAEDRARLNGAATIIWGQDTPMPEAEIEKVRQDVDAIVCGAWRYGQVSQFPRLRAILEVGGGFPSPDDLDYPTCFTRGIRVLSCAPAFGPIVAEMGLGLALACGRQIVHTDRQFRVDEPNWSHTDFVTPVGTPFTLYGKTLGFIGYGGLARSLRRLVEPFTKDIQVYDPWLTDTFLRGHGVTPVGLDHLLSTSRVIFALAVPSSGNRALLSREKLELIRPDSVFVLLSRAHIVDFDALTDLLLHGRFQAGIDVFPQEPLPKDHPIRTAAHAVLSSHRAGAHPDALHTIGRMVADDIQAIAAGLVPQALQHAEPEFIRMRG